MLQNLFRFRVQESQDVLLEKIQEMHHTLEQNLKEHVEFRFRELTAQVKELELSLTQMESRLSNKELKERQAYGLLHYKLNEIKKASPEEEIQSLEQQLKNKINKLKDI